VYRIYRTFGNLQLCIKCGPGVGLAEERALERIYQLLLTAGYPVRGVDWLRRHRLGTIIVLAIASWALFIAIGWMVWSLLTGA
jgi:hypothetical protein